MSHHNGTTIEWLVVPCGRYKCKATVRTADEQGAQAKILCAKCKKGK